MINEKEQNLEFILRWLRAFLALLTIAACLYVSAKLFPFFFPILIGMMVAECALFLGKWMQKPYLRKNPWKKPSKGLATWIYVAIVILILYWCIVGITSGMGQVKKFLLSTSETVSKTNLNELMGGVLENIQDSGTKAEVETNLSKISRQLSSDLPRFLTGLVDRMQSLAEKVPLFILYMVISIMAGYYYIGDEKNLREKLGRVTQNPEIMSCTSELISTDVQTVFRIVGGYLLLMLITFFESWVGLWFVKFPNAWIWAWIIAIIDLLPVLGITCTMIPMAIYAGLIGKTWQMVGIFTLYLLMTFARRFLEPIILGTVMRMHPLTTIVSMIVGIWVWGTGGVILGPVYFVTVYHFLHVFKMEDRLRNFVFFTKKQEKEKEETELKE